MPVTEYKIISKEIPALANFELTLGSEVLPTSGKEHLKYGKINMFTVGLGEEIDNSQLTDLLPEEMLREKRIIDEDGKRNPDKIEKLTGFVSRSQLWTHGLTLPESNSLSEQASSKMGKLALKKTGWNPGEVDIFVNLGSFPRNDIAYKMQENLQLNNACIVEATNSCSSPAIALNRLGQLQEHFPEGAKTLILGTEILTPFVEPEDLLLFSDRSEAMTFVLGEDLTVLSPSIPGITIREYPEQAGAFSIAQPPYSIEGFQTDGGVIYQSFRQRDKGRVDSIFRSKYANTKAVDESQTFVYINGRAVAVWVSRRAPQLIMDTAAATGLDLQGIKLIVPHPANRRLIEMLEGEFSKKSNVPKENLPPMYWGTDHFGNCSSLTTLYALMRALEGHGLAEDERVKDGEKILLAAFGAGLASAAAVIEVNSQDR